MENEDKLKTMRPESPYVIRLRDIHRRVRSGQHLLGLVKRISGSEYQNWTTQGAYDRVFQVLKEVHADEQLLHKTLDEMGRPEEYVEICRQICDLIVYEKLKFVWLLAEYLRDHDGLIPGDLQSTRLLNALEYGISSPSLSAFRPQYDILLKTIYALIAYHSRKRHPLYYIFIPRRLHANVERYIYKSLEIREVDRCLSILPVMIELAYMNYMKSFHEL